MRDLCGYDELAESASKGFELDGPDGRLSLFVVRRGGQVYGYLNVCPHRGTSLDWLPDQFFDPEREFLQCSTHDARFRVEDGFCVSGPCRGASLTPVEVAVVEGRVVLPES